MKVVAALIVVITTITVVIAKAPASMFIPEHYYLSQKKVMEIQSVRGSIWNGQMLLQSRVKKDQYLLNWDIKASCLLALDACVNLKLESYQSSSRAGELSIAASVPLPSFIWRDSCAMPSALHLQDLTGTITPRMIQLIVPELVDADANLKVTNFSFGLNLKAGILESATGRFEMGAGAVKFRALNNQLMRQSLAQLSGEIVRDNGFKIVMKDQGNRQYLGLETNEQGDEFNFIVYDLFARAFGAPAIPGQTGNPPRFEISQKIGDMICERSE